MLFFLSSYLSHVSACVKIEKKLETDSEFATISFSAQIYQELDFILIFLKLQNYLECWVPVWYR